MIVVVTFAVNALFNFAVGLLVAKFLGPAEFGRFALALTVAIFVNTAVLDWIRLAATRFYTDGTRANRPEVRSTLDTSFALITAALGCVGIVVLLSGIEFQLTPELVGVAVAAAVSNAVFDYHTALVRARFQDKTYGRLVGVRNAAVLILTVGGAFLWHSASMALIGMCLSVAIAVTSAGSAMADPGVSPRRASGSLARQFASYAMPIVLALNLYQLIALSNRVVITHYYGFAQTGQFSLAYDIGSKLITTIGSTLDVLLFQIAVRFDETHGAGRAREQVGRNISLVLAVLLPSCVGCWLVLPSVQALIVPVEFRGPFQHYLELLLPGLFAFAAAQFAISPIFLIAKRTLPLIAAAAAACLTDLALVMILPGGADASHLAIAQSGALIVGSLTLVGFAAATRPVWPPMRDILVICAGTAAMTALLLPLRAMPPGAATLALQIVVGLLAMGAVVFVFDLAELRTIAMGWLRTRRPAKPRAVPLADKG